MNKQEHTAEAGGTWARAYAYLLGELDDAEQFRFEHDYLSDPDVYATYLAAQDELIEDYLNDELTPARRERFATHFLVNDERRERLRLIRDLDEQVRSPATGADSLRLADTPVTASAREAALPFSARLRAFLGGSRGRFDFALRAAAVAALALLCLVGWRLMFKDRDTPLEQVKVTAPTPQNHSGEVNAPTPPVMMPSPPIAAEQQQQPAPPVTPAPPRRPPARASYALTLSPLSLRDTDDGGAHTLRLPRSSGGTLNLRLVLEDTGGFERLRAQVKTAEGVGVYEGGDLRVRQGRAVSFVTLRLSTSSLADGEYVIRLLGHAESGETTVIARYSFSVARR